MSATIAGAPVAGAAGVGSARAVGMAARPVTRALLIDLDGTLVDTAGANRAAYARALAEVGVHVEPDALAPRVDGRNWRQFLPELLAEAGVTADPAAIAQRKATLYADAAVATHPNAALVALLVASRPALATALVTTASARNAHAVLAAHGLAPLFDVIITGDDVAEHKPHPAAYQLAAARLGLVPGECVAFEDSAIGAASAEAAGIPVLRVTL